MTGGLHEEACGCGPARGGELGVAVARIATGGLARSGLRLRRGVVRPVLSRPKFTSVRRDRAAGGCLFDVDALGARKERNTRRRTSPSHPWRNGRESRADLVVMKTVPPTMTPCSVQPLRRKRRRSRPAAPGGRPRPARTGPCLDPSRTLRRPWRAGNACTCDDCRPGFSDSALRDVFAQLRKDGLAGGVVSACAGLRQTAQRRCRAPSLPAMRISSP